MLNNSNPLNLSFLNRYVLSSGIALSLVMTLAGCTQKEPHITYKQSSCIAKQTAGLADIARDLNDQIKRGRLILDNIAKTRQGNLLREAGKDNDFQKTLYHLWAVYSLAIGVMEEVDTFGLHVPSGEGYPSESWMAMMRDWIKKERLFMQSKTWDMEEIEQSAWSTSHTIEEARVEEVKALPAEIVQANIEKAEELKKLINQEVQRERGIALHGVCKKG